MQTHIITRDHIVYSFDREHSPVRKIDPGDKIRFETYDARTGTIRSEDNLLDRPHPRGANPATGPVFVKGAEPGDTLRVEILGIELASQGFIAIKAGLGNLGHLAEKYVTRLVQIEDGIVHYDDRIHFPVRPMIGVIGTAPSGEAVPTLYPGPHGGNMDHNDVKVGSCVYLPVFVEGALFGVGDVHAAMGDAEVTMTGIEICAEVTVLVNLIKGESITRPWIETDASWITTGDAPKLADAITIACEEMANLLQQKLSVSFDDAYLLMSAIGDVRISQSCQPNQFPSTIRVVFPKID
ncbi:MAG: acetamidase/formamidase family protein [Candidatus Poribacteria bacterium]|nr:acetamidase/formamidase family protein [Candidatus Poribacteria bacterium]